MDDLAALRLQIEWGADEALLDHPVDRFTQTAAPNRGTARATPPPSISVAAPSRAATPDHLSAEQAAQAAPDLQALHAALDAFDACPLRATASRTVAPSGNPAAGLVVIADAPGPDDDRAGQAFSGPPGDRLDRILRTAGLTRDELLLAMLVPWRPPGGRPAYDTELAQCLPFLLRLLQLTQPRHLVLLGIGPLRALAGPDATLRRTRGKWIPLEIAGLPAPIPTRTMLTPDMWLSSPMTKQSTWADLLSINQIVSTPP